MLFRSDLVDLDELYSCFSSQEQEEVIEDDESSEDTESSGA